VCGVIRGRAGLNVVALNDAEYAERLALTEAKVTLNGEPAKISGVYYRFATVTQLKTRLGAEWSWEAVKRVVANGGDFKS
jgi:hypothetical protein